MYGPQILPKGSINPNKVSKDIFFIRTHIYTQAIAAAAAIEIEYPSARGGVSLGVSEGSPLKPVAFGLMDEEVYYAVINHSDQITHIAKFYNLKSAS